MRIEAVLFAGNIAKAHQKMARVLAASAKQNCPSSQLTIHTISGTDSEITAVRRSNLYLNNARKTKHHRKIVHDARDGELVCLIDTDTMVLRDLAAIETYGASADFDLAYTQPAAGAKYRINSGVLFVRISDSVRDFFDRWFLTVQQMLLDEPFHNRWRDFYGGINQAALGYLLESGVAGTTCGAAGGTGIKTLTLACDEWTCEPSSYDRFGEHTRVVHVMGNLRDCCLRRSQPDSRAIGRLRDIWKSYQSLAA